MQTIKSRVYGWLGSPRALAVFWCLVALGIIPAIITGHISPLSGFGPGFGLTVEKLQFLPRLYCLLVLLFGTLICSVQRRYLLLPLLLPWLTLSIYTPQQLTFQLPTTWQGQDTLYEKLKAAKASEQAPSLDTIRQNFYAIKHSDTGIIDFDWQALENEINGFTVADETDIEKANESEEIAVENQQRESTAKQIATLNALIDKANNQLSRIDAAISAATMLSSFSFGFTNQALIDKLEDSKHNVTGQRDELQAQLNTLSVQLTPDNLDLRDLDARVSTYLWASKAYHHWQISLVYKGLCLAVLLVLLWQFSLGSWLYVSTLATALGGTFFLTEALPAYQLWLVLQFVIMSLLIRIAYLVFVENVPMLRRQSRQFLLQTARKTLLYYLPFIVLIVLGFVVTAKFNLLIDNQLYGLQIIEDANPDRTKSRRYNIDLAINLYFAKAEADAFSTIDNIPDDAGAEEVARQTLALYDGIFYQELPDYDEDLRPPSCDGFLPWVFKTAQCGERSIKQPLNEEYQSEQRSHRHSLQQSTANYTHLAEQGTAKIKQLAKADLSSHFLTFKQAIKKQLALLYFVIDFYTWLSLLLLILFTLKSLMYIFARIFFATHPDAQRCIQFEPCLQPGHQGRVWEVSSQLNLTSDLGECLFINKGFDFANAPPDEVTPQPYKAFFSRFRYGAWHMNRIWTRAADSDAVPYRRIPADERILGWTLKPGDSVIFPWKHFVGMNEQIKLRSQYSWQLSSLVFGRMFFVVASVPSDAASDGTLLLNARGSDGIDPNSSPSNSPDQLLAWQTTTRFELHANLSFRNVYRSGVQIRATKADLAIMHLNDKRQRSGAAQFIKYFVMPV